MMFYVISGILAIFLVASFLYQIKPLQPKLSKVDKLHILPNYSFFAPKPLTNDYRLVYKVISENETEWLELPMYKAFTPTRLFWNPFKYYNKGMIDTCQLLLNEFHSLENKNFIKVSSNYINIFLVISKCLKLTKDQSATVRFAILSCEGCEDVKVKNVIFASSNQLI